MSHIDDGVLHIYLDGELPSIDPSEAEAVEGHLRACHGCRHRLEQARQLRTQAHALLGRSGPAVVREPALEVLVSRTAERPLRRPLGPGRWRVSAWAASVLLALAVGWYASGRLSEGERLAGTSVPLEVASAPDALPEAEMMPEMEGTPEVENAGPEAAPRLAGSREDAAVGVPIEPAVVRASRLRSDPGAPAPDMARVEPSSGAAVAPPPTSSAVERADGGESSRRRPEEAGAYAAAPAAAPPLPTPPAPPPADAEAERGVGGIELVPASPSSTGSVVARGRVTDEQGHGLPGVHVGVRLGGRSLGTVTSTDGSYTLEIPASAARGANRLPLAATGIGYEADTVVLALAPGGAVRQDFALRSAGVALEGLVVTSAMAEVGPAPLSKATAGRWLDGTRWTAVDAARAAEHVGGRVHTLPGGRVLRAERGRIDGLAAVRTVQRVLRPGGTTFEVEVVQRRIGAAARGRRARPPAHAPPDAESGVTLQGSGRDSAPLSVATVARGEWILIVRGPVPEEMLRRLVEGMR